MTQKTDQLAQEIAKNCDDAIGTCNASLMEKLRETIKRQRARLLNGANRDLQQTATSATYYHVLRQKRCSYINQEMSRAAFVNNFQIHNYCPK